VRAVDLSAEKYCSVAQMLEKAVNITPSNEVNAASHVMPDGGVALSGLPVFIS
ncbi:hypothetical protein AB9H28_23380, partial [Salmonella enterica subsp. enterica serovar Kentucky]